MRVLISFVIQSNYGYYPTCGSTVCSSNGYAGDIKNLEIKPTYMASIPVDPVNTSTQYGYYYARGYKKAGAISYVNTSQSTDYIMATRLENSSLPAFSAWNNSYLNHLLGN